MLKDANSTCPTEGNTIRDSSPHRSTWESKEWCSVPSASLGTTQIHYFVRAEGSGGMGASTTIASSYSIEMPALLGDEPLEDSHFIFRSNDAFAEVITESIEESKWEPGSAGEEALIPTLKCATESSLSRPKRRRGTSCETVDAEGEVWNDGVMFETMGESTFRPRPPPAKRRRLHSRKPALEAAGFDAILIRLEM